MKTFNVFLLQPFVDGPKSPGGRDSNHRTHECLGAGAKYYVNPALINLGNPRTRFYSPGRSCTANSSLKNCKKGGFSEPVVVKLNVMAHTIYVVHDTPVSYDR